MAKVKQMHKDMSTISPATAIAEALFLGINLIVLYRNLLFIQVDGISVWESKMLLVALVVVSSAAGIILRWKRRMTPAGILNDIVIGLGCYSIAAYMQYYGEWFMILAAAFVCLLTAFVIYIFTRKCEGRPLSRLRNRRKKNFVIKKRILNSIDTGCSIMGILLLLYMVPILISRLVFGGILVAENPQSLDTAGFDNQYAWSEASLSHNIMNISKIRSNAEWSALTATEKLDILQDICNCEANYWGMDSKVTVVIDDLPDKTHGVYSEFEKKITIDRQHIEQDEPSEVLESVLHEMYHAWEYCLVRIYIGSSASDQKMRIFRHCKEYLTEMKNYQTGGEDHESYMRYYNQYMEQDARTYAEATVKRYYDEMEFLLGETEDVDKYYKGGSEHDQIR